MFIQHSNHYFPLHIAQKSWKGTKREEDTLADSSLRYTHLWHHFRSSIYLSMVHKSYANHFPLLQNKFSAVPKVWLGIMLSMSYQISCGCNRIRNKPIPRTGLICTNIPVTNIQQTKVLITMVIPTSLIFFLSWIRGCYDERRSCSTKILSGCDLCS